ncbi:MAG: exopolyphosphatase [Proteobacteria bacterium]|nr:exopolyphosphatase [Pseudomonadota bacterium]
MRLLTRSDFDGLACAAFLTEIGTANEYKFIHPREIQNGQVAVSVNDVLANVPYAPGCGLWFDHHSSEKERLELENLEFDGESRDSPSAAQVIWDYYGGEKTFGVRYLPLLNAANKTDTADLRLDEISHAEGWILLYFIIDPRTGLDRFEDFRLGRSEFMLDMIRYYRKMTVDEILEVPDVRERAERYYQHQTRFKDMLRRSTRIVNNVIVTDLMDEETIYCGNRFIAYARNKAQNIEIRLSRDDQKKNVVNFNCGRSIINRTSRTNVGRLMLKYGGGGHDKVGSCSVPEKDWKRVFDEILARMVKDG